MMIMQKKLGLALIPLSLVVIALLAVMTPAVAYDFPFLLLLLNTGFIGIISLIVAHLATRVYTRSGSVSILMMGSGMLVFGLGSIVTGWVLPAGGPNTAVTIYNSCACIGSVLILIGTILSMQGPVYWKGRGDIRIIAAAYTGILVFVILFSIAAVQGLTPLFFVQGVGPTALRQVILENTVVFFGIASVLGMYIYRRGRSDFFFWYSISLALISIGLLAVLIPSPVGSLVGWGGRFVQYLGFVLTLYAVLLARRESKEKRLPLDIIIANFFVDAEQNYRQLVETANDAIVTFDEDFRILLWNTAAERMFGYTRDEMIGSSFPDLVPDDRFVAVIRSGDEDPRTRDRTAYTSESREITCRKKDGTFLPVELSLSRRWQEGRLISTGILRDLTERKRFETELQAANEGLEAKVQERTADLERTTESLKSTNEQLHASYEQLAAAEEELREQYADLSRKDEEIRTLNRDLEQKVEERTAELQAANEELMSSGEELRRQFDLLTERDRQLMESEDRYRHLVDFSPDAIAVHQDGIYVYMNPAGLRLFGAATPDEIIGKKVLDLIPPKDRELIAARIRAVKDEGHSTPLRDVRALRLDGTVVDVQSTGTGILFQGRPAVMIVLRDITERRRAEEERTRLAAIVAYSDEAIIGKDLDGIVTSWNTGAERVYGYTAGEIIGKPISLLLPPDHPDDTSLILERIRNNEPVVRYETQRRRNDGRLIDITATASPIKDAEGTLMGVSTISHDITLRKEVEAALCASETRYRRLFEAAKDGILILDAETGQIVDANPFLINLLGFSHEQFLGKKIWDIGIFKDIVANKDNFKELQSKDYIRYEDLPLETYDGRHIDVEFVSNVYTAGDKKVIQCNIRNITERKKMADQINASLAEKETLLKEIHHRVKNNLQIITSILNLQIRKLDDPATIDVLKDSQSRVRSMALVHEHLYRSEDISHINLGNYIRALGTGLFQSYEASKQGVRLDLNIPDVLVDINTAIPLGLISNELITNSLKYAFQGRKDGKLSLYAIDESGALIFVVADNGIGMPEGITFENQASLGLRLVSMLTEQLNGTVAIDRTEGTKYTITVPRDAEPDKPGVKRG